ncbi:helix-turn-helix domain-containing protein [Actinoallomurus acaciae]|uniref:Helix-turn-helix transcriptional regulator n=1 Tax=Actinoallomurus acaciae TaxID=502577 RepID=A0ABV5YTZ1_9ACTN
MARDPIILVGLTTILGEHPQITPVHDPDQAVQVVVFAAETLLPSVVRQLHEVAEQDVPIVLLADNLGEASLLTLIECGVVAFVDRRSMNNDELNEAVVAAAAGEGVMSRAALGRLMTLVRQMQTDVLAPMGINGAGLSPREVDVLRLVADGADTSEIARELAYSESTVKHVLYELTSRLKLRNRCHAVAFALRAGVI